MSMEIVLKEIHDRLEAIGQSIEPTALEKIVDERLNKLLGDETFVRKMRFGSGDEKLLGTKFIRWHLSLADIEFLYDLQMALRGWPNPNGGTYAGPSQELENTFKAVSEAYYLPMDQVREIDKRAIDGLFPRIPLSWFQGKDRMLAARGAWQETQAYQQAIRAMDTAESGFGSQLVGQQYVRELWEAARSESRIFSLIPSFEMTDPTAFLPVEVDIPEVLFVSESAAPNATAYATVKTGSQRVQVDAKKFLIHQQWSGEMEEDSIIPFIPFLRRQALLSLAHYSDSLVLNGDTTNTPTGNINLDDADPADTKHYLAFDGVRHAGLVDNVGNSKDVAGAISIAAFRDSKGRMIDAPRFVDWGHPTDPGDLVYAADPETGDRIALLDEIVKKKEQAGAPLLVGEVARWLGHAVLSSLAVSKTEADGKVSTTATNNIKGQVVAFNRRGFAWGWRRRVKVELERLVRSDQTAIVYSFRAGFGRFTPTGAAAGIEAADIMYNITL